MLGELMWESGELDEAHGRAEKVVAAAAASPAGAAHAGAHLCGRGETENLAAELERVQELAPEDST